MDVTGQVLEDVLDLVLETAREHLIGLIKTEQLEVVSLHEATLHHVEHTAGRADHNVDTALKNSDIFADNSTTDAGVYFDVVELANLMDDIGDLHGELTSRRYNECLTVV